MKPKEFADYITKYLEKEVSKLSINSDFKDRVFYSLLPGGKFIRSLLAYQLTKDLNKLGHQIDQSNLDLLCAAIETHHTYTLIHDDLPAMDDDDQRRGRPSHHLRFSEWEAILAGDALLNISYQLLAKIKHQNVAKIIGMLGWAAGAKGLVYGQYLDLLGTKLKKSVSQKKINLLKTARLFQVAFLGSYLLSHQDEINYSGLKDMIRLGQYVGEIFQIVDDLDDFIEGKEEENLFYQNPKAAIGLIETLFEKLENSLDKLQLDGLKEFLFNGYFNKKNILERSREALRG